METAQQRGARTRRRLLAAARELIPELGWTAVTTRRVAERADLRPGLVHYHFASVHDLLVSAAVEATAETLTASLPLLEEAPTVAAGLTRLLEELESYDGRDTTSLLLVEAYLAAARDPGLRERMYRELERFRSAVAGWLRGHGHDAPEATSALLAATVDGMLLHRGLGPMPTTTALAVPLLRLVDTGTATGEEERCER